MPLICLSRFTLFLAIFAFPVIYAQSLDWYIAGPGDNISIFSEANWRDSITASAPPAGAVDPLVDINRDIYIRAGIPGGSSGGGQTLQLGTGSLLVSHATLRMNEANQAGIDMGTSNQSFDIIDGRVYAEFVKNGVITMSGRSELYLYGDDPLTVLENTTITLQSTDCYIYIPNIKSSRVDDADISNKFTITCPSGGKRITQYLGGAIVFAMPTGNIGLKVFDQSNLQGPLGEYTNGFYGNIGIGDVSVNSNTQYTVDGFGTDIWSNSDMFHFVYRTLSGDGEIIAYIDSISDTDVNAKAGVMIRETLDANSKNAHVYVLPDTQAGFNIRYYTSDRTWSPQSATGGTDVKKYLRLVRSGNNFSAYYSTTSVAGPWTQLGLTKQVSMTATVYIGLTVTSYAGATLNRSVFSQVSMTIGGLPAGTSALGLYDGHIDVHPPFADNDQISSLLLKKGYEVVVSEDAAGQGFSKCYVATEKDVMINFPAELDNKVSFMHVVPWRWIPKKGWGGSSSNASLVGARWNYEWEPTGSSGTDCEFVPMIKGRTQNKDYRWEEVRVRGNQTHFLGFNEPMQADQGNLTVQEALDLWPKAQQIGLRLGSPSRTDGSIGDNWLQDFMAGANARGYRVDYICVHNYNKTTAGNLQSWLQTEYNKYGLPIWLTEFNRDDSSGTVANNETYVRDVLAMLEGLPFIERYAYFNNSGVETLFDTNAANGLSSVGQYYYNQTNNMAYTSPDYGDWCTVNLSLSRGDNSLLALSADVSLGSDTIASVEFFVDDQSAGIDATAPYRINWTSPSNGLKTVYARATTIFGEQQSSQAVPLYITIPVPSGLSASGGNSSVSLNWDLDSNNAIRYFVYRSSSGSPYQIIAENLTVNYYTDNTAASATPYNYIVTALDAVSNVYGYSNVVSATPHYPGDLTLDGRVDMDDLAVLSKNWQSLYDIVTLVYIAQDWLGGTVF